MKNGSGTSVSDWLMVAATFLAAAAAAGSLWTALRQEHATFTSNLYAKEIEAFADLRVQATEFEQAVNASLTDIKYLREIKPEDAYAKYNTDLYGERLRSNFSYHDKLLSLTRAVYVVYMIAPQEIDDLVNSLGVEIDPIRNSMFILSNNVDRITTDPENTQQQTKIMTDHIVKFSQIEDHIFWCVRNFLGRGEFLPADVISSCPAESW